MTGNKSFADMKVGEVLYFGAIGSDHIAEEILVSIEILPDRDSAYTNLSEIRFTTVGHGTFRIDKRIYDKNDVLYDKFIGCGAWCGTSKEAVVECVVGALKEERDKWDRRIERLISNSK